MKKKTEPKIVVKKRKKNYVPAGDGLIHVSEDTVASAQLEDLHNGYELTAKEVNISDNVITKKAKRLIALKELAQEDYSKPKHAKFGSPSGLYALEECPGKIAFGKDLPELPPSEHAIEGTVFHTIMERVLPLYIAEKWNDVKDIIDKEADDYSDMPDFVWSTLDEVRKKWEKFKTLHPDAVMHLELKVKVNEDIFGTSDVVFVGTHRKTKKVNIVAIDYKYGRGVPVVADENLQGTAYLIGACNTLRINFSEIDKAVVVIAQVRLEGGWSVYEIKGHELESWYQKIDSIVQVAKQMYEGSLPVTLKSGSHCRFCKCMAHCPEQKNAHYNEVIVRATELPIEEMVAKLTFEQRVQIFLKKQQAEDFLKAVAQSINSDLIGGKEHELLKVIKTAGRRSWLKDEKKVADGLKKLGVVDPYNKKLKGLTEIEREVGKGMIDKLTSPGEGNYQVVHVDDKRPAVKLLEASEMPDV